MGDMQLNKIIKGRWKARKAANQGHGATDRTKSRFRSPRHRGTPKMMGCHCCNNVISTKGSRTLANRKELKYAIRDEIRENSV